LVISSGIRLVEGRDFDLDFDLDWDFECDTDDRLDKCDDFEYDFLTLFEIGVSAASRDAIGFLSDLEIDLERDFDLERDLDLSFFLLFYLSLTFSDFLIECILYLLFSSFCLFSILILLFKVKDIRYYS
jgi:hypothetical protein